MNSVPTVRVKAPSGDGFMVINAADFDHDEHELHDKKDKHLVPARSRKVVEAESANLDELSKQLGEALDRATEAESERDEWKARAEAAEEKLAVLLQDQGTGNQDDDAKGKAKAGK
jgi:hypothetical protein